MTNDVELTPREMADALTICIEAGQPAINWGPPGIGKSAVAHQVSAKLGRTVIDVRASTLDPTDLRGLPSLKDGKTVWNAPCFLPDGSTGPTTLLFDELNRAAPMTQNALLQLVLDRKLGEYTLPDDCYILCCCNREQDGGGVSKMNSALSNRFAHLHMKPDINDWSRWAITNGVEPVTIAYVRSFPDQLFRFDRSERAYPTPRSWEFVSRITKQKPSPAIELALFNGAVGAGSGTQYAAFLQAFAQCPNLDAIILNPTSAPVPTDPAPLFAVASGLAHRMDMGNITRIFQYFARMKAEYAVLGVTLALKRNHLLASTPDFTRWTIANAEVAF